MRRGKLLTIYDTLQGRVTNCPTKQRFLMKSVIKYIFSESKQVWDPIFCSVSDVTGVDVYTTITQKCALNFTEKSDLLFLFIIRFQKLLRIDVVYMPI